MLFKKIGYWAFLAGVILVALFLLSTTLPIPGGYKALIVTSGSMEPSIKTGSLVLIKPSESYRAGDVITFESSGSKIPTTHRIVDVSAKSGVEYYKTKGDANENVDGAEVRKSDVLGKVFLSVPYAGYISDFAKKPLGFTLLVGFPILYVVYDEISKIVSEVKKMRRKKEEDIENIENNEK